MARRLSTKVCQGAVGEGGDGRGSGGPRPVSADLLCQELPVHSPLVRKHAAQFEGAADVGDGVGDQEGSADQELPMFACVEGGASARWVKAWVAGVGAGMRGRAAHLEEGTQRNIGGGASGPHCHEEEDKEAWGEEQNVHLDRDGGAEEQGAHRPLAARARAGGEGRAVRGCAAAHPLPQEERDGRVEEKHGHAVVEQAQHEDGVDTFGQREQCENPGRAEARSGENVHH